MYSKRKVLTIVASVLILSIATPASAITFTARSEADTFGIVAQIEGNTANGKGWVNFYANIQNVPDFSYAIGDRGGMSSEVEFEWEYINWYDEETGTWNYEYSDSIIRVRANFDLDLQIVPNPIDNGNYSIGGGINQNLFGTEYYQHSWLNIENDEIWADGFLNMTGWQLNNVYLNIKTEERFHWGDWIYNEETGEWTEGEITIENWLEIDARAYGIIDLTQLAETIDPIILDNFVTSLDVQFITVPEPATLLLLGAAGLLLRRRRR